VFPDALGGWRDPNNVRRVWREVRRELPFDGLVSHTLRRDRQTADVVEEILGGDAADQRKVSE
jgi:hypothetical protein